MMTFLEYAISKYLGPPTYRHGDGQSEWLCPMCSSSKFHTMPDKPEFKHRYKCWTCNFRGDLADWIREQHPGETYGEHLARIDRLRQEWQALKDREPLALHSRGLAGSIHARGYGCDDPRDHEFCDEADVAVMELKADDTPTDILREQERALEVCARHGLHPLGFARRLEFIAWVEETEHEHMAGCEDPNCEWACCRRARGLKPLKSRSVKETKRKGNQSGANSNKPAHEATTGNSDKTARKRTGKR